MRERRRTRKEKGIKIKVRRKGKEVGEKEDVVMYSSDFAVMALASCFLPRVLPDRRTYTHLHTHRQSLCVPTVPPAVRLW